MGTKNNPGTFDCYLNAEDDEPMFVLLARDATAPFLVEKWALDRARAIDLGLKPFSDRPMVEEAKACARAMREWRAAHRANAAVFESGDTPQPECFCGRTEPHYHRDTLDGEEIVRLPDDRFGIARFESGDTPQ